MYLFHPYINMLAFWKASVQYIKVTLTPDLIQKPHGLGVRILVLLAQLARAIVETYYRLFETQRRLEDNRGCMAYVRCFET
jgi:hypothetical protein